MGKQSVTNLVHCLVKTQMYTKHKKIVLRSKKKKNIVKKVKDIGN